MNKIIYLLIIFPLLILGCKRVLNNEIKFLQKIDTLDMNIYSNNGKKLYTIKSPESSYDKNNYTFNLKSTTIHLFKDQKVIYIINSDESTLSDNNRILELNGNVQINTKDSQDLIINSDQFIWNIDDSKYSLIGKVKLENNKLYLSSNKATLSKEDLIKFHKPVKYIIKGDNNSKVYEIDSENAYYNIKTKSVSFSSQKKRVRSKFYF